MKLQFPITQIQHWADAYLNKNHGYDDKVLVLRDSIQKRGYLKPDELQTVATWLLPPINSFFRKERPLDIEYIKKITGDALASDDENEKIKELRMIEGVGPSMASAILHLYDQGRYPIFTSKSLGSLGINLQFTYNFWGKYVQFTRDLADEAKVDMRTLDRALWQHNKENN